MINLFTTYFISDSKARQDEIDFCLVENSRNRFVDRICLVVNDDDISRPTFNDFFGCIANLSGPNDINIIANSDIYFDETLGLALDIPEKTVYALTRWDRVANGRLIFRPIVGSQDVWIFRGVPKGIRGGFQIGIYACDNRLAWEIRAAGYNLLNPSRLIKAIHHHPSGVKTYSSIPPVPPPYASVPIQDTLK